MTVSNRLAECQRVIGYHFADPSLLEVALTHSSVRTPDRECNERLEFLGDSVLGLTITEELYKRLPDQQEGELTRIKSAVVSRGALYRVSTRLGLTRFIEVAKGVSRKEELPVSLTANLVESIIGAIYLDAGFFPAREFILKNLGPEVEDVMNDRVAKNYKSLLQHEAQQILGATPVYRTLEEEGPDHRKAFVVAAVVRGTEYGRASGINKKEAEQEAARHALEALLRRRGGRRRRGGLTLERLESRDLRDGRDYIVREGGSDEGPDADASGEGASRGDYRGPARGARLARGGRGGRRRTRDLRPSVAQSKDDADWKAWAEGAGGAPPPTQASSAGGPSGPSAPYVVGPEPEEAYFDAPDRAAPPEGGGGRASSESPRNGGEATPNGDEMPAGAAPSGDGSADEPRRRRGARRGGRRGGRSARGSGGAHEGPPRDAPDAAHEAEATLSRSPNGRGIAPEADEDAAPPPEPRGSESVRESSAEGIPAAFIAPEPDAAPARGTGPTGPVGEPSSWPDFGAEPAERAPARRAREPRGRGRGAASDRAPRERSTPRRGGERPAAAAPTTPPASSPSSASPSKPPPSSPKSRETSSLPGFGAGVIADTPGAQGAPPATPPPAAPPPVPVTVVPAVPAVPAVRKVPRVPPPPKPTDGGGFGAGLA